MSCYVEAGVDFSFRSAFRDLSACAAQAGSWGLVNLLQIAGRANRSGEYSDTEVWDDESGGLGLQSQAELPRRIPAGTYTDYAL